MSNMKDISRNKIEKRVEKILEKGISSSDKADMISAFISSVMDAKDKKISKLSSKIDLLNGDLKVENKRIRGALKSAIDKGRGSITLINLSSSSRDIFNTLKNK